MPHSWPAKIPRPIVDQLNRAVQNSFDAEQKSKLTGSGIEFSTSTPEEFQKLIAKDSKVHVDLVKAAGLVQQ